MSQPVKYLLRSFCAQVKSLSHVRLFATPWIVAYQSPLSMGFSRQGYRSGLPFPSPEDLPDTGIEPECPAWPTDSLARATWETLVPNWPFHCPRLCGMLRSMLISMAVTASLSLEPQMVDSPKSRRKVYSGIYNFNLSSLSRPS